MMSEDSPHVVVPPPLIFGGLLAAGLFIECESRAFGTRQIFALALGTAGIGLIALAVGLFRTHKTRPEPWQPASVLVASGIYRLTRNPMYLGMAILSLAVALFFASLPAAALTLIAAIVVDRAVIAREEAYLMRRFGDDYAAYRRTVRRWL